MEDRKEKLPSVLEGVANQKEAVFYRIIGIDTQDEDEYAESIHSFFELLNEKGIQYHWFQNGFDYDVDDSLANEMNRFWVTVTKLKDNNSKVIVDVTFAYRKHPDISKESHELIKPALSRTLDAFRKNQVNLDVIKNFYITLIHWIEKYVPVLAKESNSLAQSAFLFWGNIKRNEAYFLLFLKFLGVKVVYFNPYSEDGTAKVNGIEQHSIKKEWSRKKVLNELPKRVMKTKTAAAKAQKELHEVLHTDSSGLYKPWQFEEYHARVVPLQTTLEELFILWKEPANYRTGFEVKNGEVHIPNIFAKISGVPEQMNKYWGEVNSLRNAENVLFFERVPLIPTLHYHNQNIVLKNGKFQADDIKKLREYDFHHLRAPIQEDIIDGINSLISDQELFVGMDKVKDFSYAVLHTALRMGHSITTMLQTFDYAHQIPKLVIFDQDKSLFSSFDAILLGLLHRLGWDIVILTPTGYQNIEQFIHKKFVDHHKRERFVFDAVVPTYGKEKKSWIDKWFN